MPFAEYKKPQTLEEALRLKEAQAGARFIAGGTDLLVQLKNKSIAAPLALISLRSISDLKGIAIGEKTRLGACTPISDILSNQGIAERYPVLFEAASHLGSVQIRNVATIGGNLCNASPCADTSLPLLVLDAKVELQGREGTRQVALEDFYRGPGQTCLNPGELLVAILLDPPRPHAKSIFFKKRRVAMDLAQASVAMLLELEGDICRFARIAAGSVAPTPMRLKPVEALLEGKKLTSELIAEAQALASRTISPITDLRASADFRRQIIGVFIKRGIEQLLPPPKKETMPPQDRRCQ